MRQHGSPSADSHVPLRSAAIPPLDRLRYVFLYLCNLEYGKVPCLLSVSSHNPHRAHHDQHKLTRILCSDTLVGLAVQRPSPISVSRGRSKRQWMFDGITCPEIMRVTLGRATVR